MSMFRTSLCLPIFRLTVNRSLQYSVRNSGMSRLHTSSRKKKESKKMEGDNPYPFMSSIENQSFQTSETFKKPGNLDAWRFQGTTISLCLTALLLYFCVFRKENHIDRQLEKSLYLAVPNLEEHDLKAKINNAKDQGHDTKELEERLALVKARK